MAQVPTYFTELLCRSANTLYEIVWLLFVTFMIICSKKIGNANSVGVSGTTTTRAISLKSSYKYTLLYHLIVYKYHTITQPFISTSEVPITAYVGCMGLVLETYRGLLLSIQLLFLIFSESMPKELHLHAHK